MTQKVQLFTCHCCCCVAKCIRLSEFLLPRLTWAVKTPDPIIRRIKMCTNILETVRYIVSLLSVPRAMIKYKSTWRWATTSVYNFYFQGNFPSFFYFVLVSAIWQPRLWSWFVDSLKTVFWLLISLWCIPYFTFVLSEKWYCLINGKTED